MSTAHALGRSGEELAAQWYSQHGYEVIARNWRCGEGEADVIARRGRVLVVCEVKTRSHLGYGSPAEAVTPARRRRLRGTALRFLQADSTVLASWHPGLIRFDVAEVMDGAVSVIQDAF
ncbi:MAG: YraN family protein [Acidimicrobiales bacterium]